MMFINLQHHVTCLLKKSAAFSTSPVFENVGFSKPAIEAALDYKAGNKGYALSVWPPARGTSNRELGGQVGTDAMIVTRFEANPQWLKTLKKPAHWLNGCLTALASAVLSDPPEMNGVTFTLAQEAFELVNFDEGLVAYHFRFERFVVFGSPPANADGAWTADSEIITADAI